MRGLQAGLGVEDEVFVGEGVEGGDDVEGCGSKEDVECPADAPGNGLSAGSMSGEIGAVFAVRGDQVRDRDGEESEGYGLDGLEGSHLCESGVCRSIVGKTRK